MVCPLLALSGHLASTATRFPKKVSDKPLGPIRASQVKNRLVRRGDREGKI
jgi:hypothetical protein